MVELSRFIVESKKFATLFVMKLAIFELMEPQSILTLSIICFAQSYLLLRSFIQYLKSSNADGIEPAIFCRLLLISGMMIIKIYQHQFYLQ